MSIFSSLLPIFLLIIIPFSPSAFILYYIIKSLINKKLSKKSAIGWSVYMIVTIILYLVPLVDYINSDPYQDTSGVFFVGVILLELINIFILWLFYGLYYMYINKSNKDVDSKKPLKTFGKLLLLFILGCIAFYYVSRCLNFREENKNYFEARNIKPEIIKVNNFDNIPILSDYKIYKKSDIVNDSEDYINKKIFIKGYSTSSYLDSMDDVTKWSIYSSYGEDCMTPYNIYFSSNEKYYNNTFTYIYGTIKNVEWGERDIGEDYINIIPEKIYYMDKDSYSLNTSEEYNGKWCLDNKCFNFYTNNSILEKITFIDGDNDPTDLYFEQYPDNTILVQDYELNLYAYFSLKDSKIYLNVTEFEYIADGDYTLTKAVDYVAKFMSYYHQDTRHITYIYKENNDQDNYGFYYVNKIENDFGLKTLDKGHIMWTDEVFNVALNNNAYDYVLLPNDETKYTIEEFQTIFLKN